MKDNTDQRLKARTPRQDRARHKVELILQAAMRLLAKGGLAGFTTNAVAETAGVSIGTLYQYFADKAAILDALAEREMAGLSHGILAALQDPAEMPPPERVGRVIRAVTLAYGGQRQVHRALMEHSLTRGGRRLAPLIEQLMAFLTANGRLAADGSPIPLSRADAFVLTNAFAGVIRARVLWQDASTPPSDQIDEALVRLIVNFTEGR